MAHFNFVISQNAKLGHAGFYIDCHRMTVPENILLQKKSTGCAAASLSITGAHRRRSEGALVAGLERHGPQHR